MAALTNKPEGWIELTFAKRSGRLLIEVSQIGPLDYSPISGFTMLQSKGSEFRYLVTETPELIFALMKEARR